MSTEHTAALTTILTALTTILTALIAALFPTYTHCRACGSQLKVVNGEVLPFIGYGFCPQCAAEILRDTQR